MKPEHLKLAGIATLVCGAMSSFGAEAATSDPSVLATGRVLSLRNTSTDPALGMTDDTAQDTEPAMQGDMPDGVAPEADAGAGVAPAADAASDGVYTARTAVWQSPDSDETSVARPASAHLRYVPTVFSVPAVSADESSAPVASVVPDSQDPQDSHAMPAASTGDVASAHDVAPVSNVAPADHVEPVLNVAPDVVHAQDDPAASADHSSAAADAARDALPVDETPTVSTSATAVPATVAATHARHVAHTPHRPVVSADDGVPVKDAVLPSARVADTPRMSVSVAVPAMCAVPNTARVPNAPDDLARQPIVSTSAMSSNVARNADSAAVPARSAARTTPDAVSPNVAHSNEAAPVTASSAEGLLERAAVSLKSTVDLAAQPAMPHAAKHDDDEDPAWASADLVAVDSDRLDSMRGGFDLPSGLVVSFGISREAFVNGNLVASTSFNIPNIAQMTPQQAQMLANANTGALVQNGLNNTVAPGALPALTGSVIQNSLNNQQVQALTTINTSVNSLAAFKASNIGMTLNSALISAVRPR